MDAPLLEMTERLREILERAERSAAEYLSHESQLLMALIEVDRATAYHCFGFTHLTPYCVRELGLSEDIAAIFVRVVRISHEVPELAAAVVSGELQITKAKTIAAVITPANRAEWIAKASRVSKHELEKAVLKASGRDTQTVSFELTPEEQELFRRVQELLCAKLDHSPSKEETLNWMTEFTLQKIDPVRKADRSRDRARAKLRAPEERTPEPRKSELRAGKSRRSRDRSREVTVEDQVTARDRGRCQARMPDGVICGEAKWTHQHHIIPRELGGEDKTENLITLCASHHRLVHGEHEPALTRESVC